MEKWAADGERRGDWNSRDGNYTDVDFSRGGGARESMDDPVVASNSRKKTPRTESEPRSGFFSRRDKPVKPEKQKPAESPDQVVASNNRQPEQISKPAFASKPAREHSGNSRLIASAGRRGTWNSNAYPRPAGNFNDSTAPVAPANVAPSGRGPTVSVNAPPRQRPTVTRPAPAQKLKPPPPKPKPAPKPVTPKKYHLVVKGDTLYNISKRYGTSVPAIKSRNGLGSNTIGLGQRLVIP